MWGDVKVRESPVVGERIDTLGIDWGPKGIVLIHREGNYGIWKTPGHNAWTSNFTPWSWYLARYGILQFSVDESDGYWGTFNLLRDTEIAPGLYYRSAITELKSQVSGLCLKDRVKDRGQEEGWDKEWYGV